MLLVTGEQDTMTIFSANGAELERIATVALGKGAVRLLALDLTTLAAL